MPHFRICLVAALLGVAPIASLLAADLVVDGPNSPYSFNTLASYDNVYVGENTTGTLNQTGGLLDVTTGQLFLGSNAGSFGMYNLSGGTLDTISTDVGDSGTGVFTLSDNGVHNVTGTDGTANGSLDLAFYGGSTGTYNLNGGTLTAGYVRGGSGTSTFNFNGGTLVAGASASDFFQNLTHAYVQAGGAVINTNNSNVTIAQSLVSGTAGGTVDGGLTKLGARTLTLTGANTYTGATQVNGGTLQLGAANALPEYTNVTLTNTAGATFDLNGFDATIASLAGGGSAGGNVTLGSAGLTTVGGSSTFAGAISGTGSLTIALSPQGTTLTLSGANTYTGNTTVQTGTLAVTGSITSGSGATLSLDSISSIIPAIVNLSGTGSLSVGLVSDGSNSTINLNGGTLTASYVQGLAGSNSDGTFNFNGGTLTAGASATDFFQNLNHAYVASGGAVINTNGFNVTVAQNLEHTSAGGAAAADGGLTKLGAGTLTLSGANTYTGNTTVSAGTLAVTGGITSSGATLTVDGDSTTALSLSGTGSLSTGTAYVGYAGEGTLTQTGGTFTTSGYSLYLGYGGSDTVRSSGTYNLSGGSLTPGSVYVGYNGVGTFTQTGGSFSPSGVFTVGYGGTGSGTYTLSAGGLTTGSVQLGYSGAGTVTQTGGTFTTGPILLGINTAGDAIGTGTYNLNGGLLTASGVSGYDGTSTFHFNGGTLQAAASSTQFLAGLTTADVQAGGALIDTQAFNVTVAQALTNGTASGTDGGLTKLGTGTLILTGASTYLGATTISAGTLAANNTMGSATGTGAVTVGYGGTLAGNGNVSGAVTVQSGGTLAPGELTVNRLTLGSTLALQSGSTLAIKLGGTVTGSYDEVLVAGAVTLGGSLSVSTVNGFKLTAGETFTILDNTGTALTDGLFTNAAGPLYTDAAGDTFLVNYAAKADGGTVPNDVTLTYLGVDVVPEPSTWAFLVAAAGGLLAVVRRRWSRQVAA